MATEVIPPPPDATIPPPPDAPTPSGRRYIGGGHYTEGGQVKLLDPAKPDVYTDPAIQAGLKESRRAGGILAGTEKPQSLEESALQAVGAVPLYAAGGGAGGLVGLPALGRIAAAAGLSRLRGEDLPHTLIDVAGAGVGEVGAKVAGKALGALAGTAEREAGRVAEAARVGREIKDILPHLEAETDTALFGASRKHMDKVLGEVMSPALAQIKQRLGPVVRFDVPSLGSGRVTLEEAIEGMWKASRETRPQVRAEIMAKLSQLDPQGAAGAIFDEALKLRAAARTYLGVVDKALDASGKYDPRRAAEFVNKNTAKLQRYAGKYWPKLESVFLQGKQAPVALPAKAEAARVLGHKVEVPMAASEMARQARDVVTGPGLHSTVDAVLGTPPFGAVALGAAEKGLRPAMRHIPGGREVSETIEEVAGEGE